MYIVGRGQKVRRDREGQTRELSQREVFHDLYITCLNIEKSDFSCQYVCCVGLNPGA